MSHDSKSLVKRTIERQAAGRVPLGELCIDDALVAAFTGSSRVGFSQRLDVAERLGLDLICLAPDYGRLNGKGALPLAENVGLNAIRTWAGKTDLFIFVLLDGGLGWGLRTWGFQQFLIMVMRQSAEVADLLQHVETLNLRLIRRAADLGADGIVIGEDFAFQGGLLLSPDQIRALLLPSLVRQTEASHAAGLPVFLHCDGNINPLMEDIAGSGFDGLQGIEAAAGMDLEKIRADYGRRLCCWGNLDPACLVQGLSAGDIDTRVKAVLSSGNTDSGLIFGTSSGLFSGMRPRSIEQTYTCARRFGRRIEKSHTDDTKLG